MTFGSRLQELRKERGMTQRALASQLEMDFAYLSRIENDYFNHLPARDTIERIAGILNLTADESDELHVLAGKLPADIELILFEQPKLMRSIRRKA
jgi:transcriptional regulator with XRE-family HTH domain